MTGISDDRLNPSTLGLCNVEGASNVTLDSERGQLTKGLPTPEPPTVPHKSVAWLNTIYYNLHSRPPNRPSPRKSWRLISLLPNHGACNYFVGSISIYPTRVHAQLLGREYYQTSFGEKYLVLAPLAIHSLSGLTKRLLSFKPISPERKSPVPARPLTSLLSWTGYATALVFLPIHFITHRLNPTSTDAPISSVGPAELDYEFVKLGLQRWPVRSWLFYTGLVFSVALHMADGATIIWNTWFRNTVGTWSGGSGSKNGDMQRPRHRKLVTVIGGSMISVLAGLYVISKEPPVIFVSMAKRFEAVFNKSFVYRI